MESQAELTVLVSTLGRKASINRSPLFEPPIQTPDRELVFVANRRSRQWRNPIAKPEVVISAVIEVLDEIRPSEPHEP